MAPGGGRPGDAPETQRRRSRRRREPVYLEIGRSRVFAASLDWPGWCRSGRDPEGALAALAAYALRYEAVASRAGFRFDFSLADDFNVVEQLPGSPTTDFGVPAAVRPGDEGAIEPDELGRVLALLASSWETLAAVVAAAPAVMRKGPRGGGRDRDAIVEHVIAAEIEYARKLGLARRKVTASDPLGVESMREEMLSALRGAAGGGRPPGAGWPARYAVRRIAWHVLDHAWEIEDKGTPDEG